MQQTNITLHLKEHGLFQSFFMFYPHQIQNCFKNKQVIILTNIFKIFPMITQQLDPIQPCCQILNFTSVGSLKTGAKI